MKKLIPFLILILSSTFIYAQEIPISLLERINQVDYVFEGKVIESNSYFVENSRRIQTSNTIEIYKIFKGNLSCGTVELICEDGKILNTEQRTSHSLNLKKGQIGVFMGKQTSRELSTIDFYNETNLEKLEATFQEQSYIKYWFDGFEHRASDLWQQYDSIAQFYNFAEQITGYSYIDCNNSSLIKRPTQPKSTNSFLISLVTPLVVNGGVKDTLNIKGLNFGLTRGKGNVFFKNANDGGASEIFLNDDDFILWSDTLIQVYVPSRDTATNDSINSNDYPAGSGTIRVVTNDGDEEISDDFVTINYSVYNSPEKRLQCIATRENFNQKIIFRCDTSVANFANGLMKAVIKRAITDWTCLTGVNWELGKDTFGISSGEDSLCVINFSANLNSNTIAETKSYGGTCVSDAFYWESDMDINSTKKFFFDTFSITHSSDSVDFYHTMLHEFGHAHHLEHKIDENAIMHFRSVDFRVVDLKNDVGCDEGGNYIMDTSILVDYLCLEMEHILQVYPNSGCDFSPTSISAIQNDLNVKIYPVPTKGRLVLDFENNNSRNIKLFGIDGKLEKTFTSQDQYTSIDITDFSDGIYFLQIKEKQKVSMFKILKE